MHAFITELGHLAHGVLNTPAIATKVSPHGQYHSSHGRRDREKNQRQLPVEVQHVTDQRQNGKPVAQNRFQRLGRCPADLLYVEGELGHQLAVGVTVNELLGHSDQDIENLCAQPVDNASGYNIHKVIAEKISTGAHDRQDNGRDRHRNPRVIQRVFIARRPEPVRRLRDKTHTHWRCLSKGVEQKLSEIGEEHVSHRIHQKTHNTQQECAAMRRHIAQ